MQRKPNYQYYVEGEDEKKLIHTLKTDLQCIVSGKVDRLNVIQEKFPIARIRTLKQGTTVILLFDTDVEKTDILKNNIEFLRKHSAIKEVICIPQVKNLEEELLYSCNIKDIEKLTHSCSKKDFKRDLIKCTNLKERLQVCGFSVDKLWSRQASGVFGDIINGSEKIKIRSKF